MGTKFRSLKDQLKELEQSDLGKKVSPELRKTDVRSHISISNWGRYVLFGAFMLAFIFYAGARYDISGVDLQSVNPVEEFFSWVDQPDDQLLEDMGAWMEEMGYTGLTKEDLIDLREEGVTATFTSRMRDLGYENLTLDDLVRLRQNDVSATFTAMMKELGYDLTVDDLVQLRQHGVTAYYTSNLHDLGYTDITKEELIRLKDTGVRTSEVEQLIQESESLPAIEELIRYRISNQ